MSEESKSRPSLVEIETQAVAIRQEMNSIVITDQDTYNVAVEKRTAAKKWLAGAEAWFDGIQKPAYDAYKNILNQRKLVTEPTETAIRKINAALVTWDREQEQKRLAEQRRLEEQARKEAEEQRLADAIHQEQQGAPKEVVEEIISAPVVVHTPAIAAPTYEKSKAVVYRDNWSGECTDLFALVKAIAKDKGKLGLIQINQPALNKMAQALKESMAIPGCKAVNNKTVVTGRG